MTPPATTSFSSDSFLYLVTYLRSSNLKKKKKKKQIYSFTHPSELFPFLLSDTTCSIQMHMYYGFMQSSIIFCPIPFLHLVATELMFP